MVKRKLKSENKINNKVDQLMTQITSNIKGRKHGKKYQYNDVEKKRLLVELIRNGQSLKDAAEAVGIKTNTAKTIMYRYRVNGDKLIIKRRGGGRATKLNSNVLKCIAEIVNVNPKITFNGIRQKLLHTEQITLSMGSIKNAIDKIKKNYMQMDDQTKSKFTANEHFAYVKSSAEQQQSEQQPQQIIMDSNSISRPLWEGYTNNQCTGPDPLINGSLNMIECLKPINENCTNRTELLLEQLVEEQKKTNILLEKTIKLLYYSHGNEWKMNE